jgi:hypothetical protein
MFSRRHHTAIFIISKFMLLLLKDLLAKLIITSTLKDKLTTWLCLVEGYLTSLCDSATAPWTTSHHGAP